MIDGASRLYAFWRITLPLAAPALLVGHARSPSPPPGTSSCSPSSSSPANRSGPCRSACSRWWWATSCPGASSWPPRCSRRSRWRSSTSTPRRYLTEGLTVGGGEGVDGPLGFQSGQRGYRQDPFGTVAAGWTKISRSMRRSPRPRAITSSPRRSRCSTTTSASGWSLTRKLSLRQPVQRLLLVREEHRQVLEAIAARDAATAARAMASHIDNARRRMFEGAAHEGESTRMYVGTQMAARRRRLPGLGPARRHACLRRPAGQPAHWTLDDLLRHRDRSRASASALDMVQLPLARGRSRRARARTSCSARARARRADRQHLRADRAARRGRHPGGQIQPQHHRHPAHRAASRGAAARATRPSAGPRRTRTRRPARRRARRRRRTGSGSTISSARRAGRRAAPRCASPAIRTIPTRRRATAA